MFRQSRIWIIGAILVVAAGIATTVIATSGDDRAAPPTSTSSSTSTSTTTTSVPVDDTEAAVFPPTGTTRFTDPVAAANAFVTEVVGFVDPFVGTFRQGDARSGEVDVRPFADGPVSTVFVRRLGPDDAWYVIGTATVNITVTQPTPLATIASPVALAGTSTAFEGTVRVEVRVDGRDQPIASGFVTGGANGELGPFQDTLAFPSPGATSGSIVFFTVSAEDGRILETAVVRVHYA
ncbi:MAG: Gmad2 immunoglobulin-like domain-containing protein [Acidimicrobiia bacterium]